MRRRPDKTRIAVLMTCHNRRELTMRCLASLAAQDIFRAEDLYLVDDGSTDGTASAVRAAFPEATIVRGDGSLFWNRGMARAWVEAAGSGRNFDYFLWLNDDVLLAPGALSRLLADAQAFARADGAIVCAGATCDPDDPSRTTYGGHRRPDPVRRPLRMMLVEPAGTAVPVDAISGNIVLVSDAAFRKLGTHDPMFEHIYGDLDYGLRAHAAGIPVILSGAFAGSCEQNPVDGTSDDAKLSRLQRLVRRKREGRSIHARDWRRFTARYGGGPVRRLGYRMMPYLRILLGRPNRHAAASDG